VKCVSEVCECEAFVLVICQVMMCVCVTENWNDCLCVKGVCVCDMCACDTCVGDVSGHDVCVCDI